MNPGWPELDRREAPVVRLRADFRGFAQSGSNPGHPFFCDRLKKAKALSPPTPVSTSAIDFDRRGFHLCFICENLWLKTLFFNVLWLPQVFVKTI